MIGALCIAAPIGVSILGGLTYATVAPACSFWGSLIARGRSDSNQVALTFDDGPTPGSTDRILDCLRDADVKAAFFVIGCNVKKHPDLLRRIDSEGHLVCNHSFEHSHYTVFRRWPYWKREIERTGDAIEEVLGFRPRIFRPPMGVKTWHTSIARKRTGQTIVTWSRRAFDGLSTNADRILNRFSNVTGGEILLLHDGVEPHAPHTDRSATIAAVPRLIESLRAKNLQPDRLDHLLNLSPYTVTPGAPAGSGADVK
jgi:peptidoglycan/xylan/chitin deacetylase (PgdA/CDA1 family)